MPILQLHNVRRVFRKGESRVYALRGVDMSIEKGEFLSIVGPSGSGKSTLLNIIGCLDSPTEGSVIYDGKQLGGLTENQLSGYRKHNIAFIFQSYNLIPVLSVVENVELPLIIEKRHSKKEIRKRAMEMIELVGLESKAHRRPGELSGGQEQRVAIARALVKRPLIVLADEPTANLDSSTAEEIVSIMQTINKDLGSTFVFSTHDKLVESHALRVVVLRDGMIHSDQRKVS
ncbi:ABC transporter ATP-binding protein [Chitinispirillales bacterium ANBcel5]|uniref:ABC transporter ATP-binding protein n=1 Tax=Cellulosispirillum alkaliphilum TaxID=3039283 RepID=UPI002A52860E|nr:ABC transporter ATP-binding protein [Chitinispirillales bacterium ANBcel5]